VRTVRREAPLPALRGLPWAGRSTGGASEANRGELMFDPGASMPRYRLWNGVPDIRNRQQIAEQSATFRD
jgi:hypothetical protein